MDSPVSCLPCHRSLHALGVPEDADPSLSWGHGGHWFLPCPRIWQYGSLPCLLAMGTLIPVLPGAMGTLISALPRATGTLIPALSGIMGTLIPALPGAMVALIPAMPGDIGDSDLCPA